MNQDMLLRLVITGDGKVAVQAVEQVTGATKGLDAAQKAAASGTTSAKRTADEYIASLRGQLTALQSNAAALREVEAISRGATASQIADMRALGAQIDALHAKQLGGAGASSLLAGGMRAVAVASGVMAAAMVIAAPAAQLAQAHDEARVLLARINGITGSLHEARAVYAGLVQDAIRLRIGVDDALAGYTRIGMAVKELGGTATQARQINELVIATAKISGVSAQEAAAAARQFAQALGSGVLQGDELKSILENNQELARQLAKGLGVSVGELRKLGEEGKLTADVVANALLGRLPEIREKLADVPLTSAEAWQKLKTVMGNWVVEGDKVDMKASLIARAMNAIAEGIERSRKAAEQPIVVTVRQVYQTEGGAGFIGPNLGRRSPAQIAAEEAAARAATNATRGNASASVRAIDNEAILAYSLGLVAAGKKAIEAAEQYADGLGLASQKIVKAHEKQLKEFTQARAKLSEAAASQDPTISAKAGEQLAKLNALELQATVGFQRKLAEARKTEANKANQGVQQEADAHYKQLIAREEAYQNAVKADVKEGLDVEKHKYEAMQTTAAEYYTAVANLQTIGLNQQQASVEKELAAARARGQRGVAEAEKYEGQLALIEKQKTKVVNDANDSILAADRKFWSARIKEMQAFDEAASKYAQGTYEILAASQAVNEEKQFELSIAHLSEEAQKRAIALRKIEIERTKALTAAELEYFEMKKAARTEADFEAALSFYKTRIAAINQAKDGEAAMTVAVLEQKAALDQTKQFWDGFFQSLKGGWKGVRDYVKNFFFDWLLKQLSQQFTMNIAVGASGGAGGGIGGIISALLGGGSGGASGGGASSGFGGVLGGALSGIFGSAVGGLNGLLGLGTGGTLAMGANSLFAGFATGGISGALGGIGASFAGGGLVAGLGSLIPVIGPLIAIAMIAKQVLKNKEGLWFDFGSQYMGKGKGASQEFDTALGSIAIRGEGKLDDVKPFVAQMQNLAKNFVDIFGQTLADKARTALGNWTGFSNRGKGTEYENGQELAAALATESKDVMAEYFSRVFSVVDQRLADTISAWTGTTEELTKYIQGILGVQQSLTQQAPLLKAIIGETITLSQVVDLQKEGEALADTFSRILNAFSITNSIAEAMGKGADAFGEVGIKSLEARERLIALSGGLQALSGNMTTYLEQFFTEQERAAMQQKLAMQQLEAGFSALGLAVPTSREAFRALVQGIDLTTVAGQELFAALIKLAPAFASAVPANDAPAVTDAVGRSEDYLANFFTAAERAAMQLAESGKAVDDVFALLGLSVPKTRDEFRALVESQDLTTESGRKTYNALMAIAAQFVDLTAVTVQATNALADYRVSFADSVASAINSLAGPLDQVFSIIDASSVGMSEKLQRKLIAVATGIANANAALASLPEGNTAAPTYRAAILSLQQQQAALAGDLALYTSLSAQYGSALADSMYELEKWKQTQLTAAGGSAAALLAIEQTYQDKRAAILNGGVASGLETLKSTLRAWLNSLLLNNQLTTLTPLQRLEEARAQYEAAITSGDAGKITSAADAYLREARDYFASGAGYNQIFAMVRAQVNTLANGGTVYVAPAPNTAPGTNGAGNVAGAAALAATTAANVASNAADATTRAVQQSQQVLADIMAAVKHTINDEAEAQRAADATNTAAIVAAVSAPSRIAV